MWSEEERKLSSFSQLFPRDMNMINCFTYEFDFSCSLALRVVLYLSLLSAREPSVQLAQLQILMPSSHFFFILLLCFSLFSTLMGPTIHHVAQNNAFG